MQWLAKLGGTLCLILLCAGAVSAIDVDVQPDTVQLRPADDESGTFNVSVTNTASVIRGFTVDYRVASPGWYFLPEYTFTLAPGETRYLPLHVTPDRDAVEGNKGVRVLVSSGEEQVENRVIVQIVRDRTVLITGMATDQVEYLPGTAANISVTVKNVRDHEISQNAYRLVIGYDDYTETVPVPGLQPSESVTLTDTIPVDQFDQGVKSVTARVERLDGTQQDERTATIEVATVENVKQQQKQKLGVLTTTTMFTVENAGNRQASETQVTGRVPSYLSWFVSFDRQPTMQKTVAGTTLYTWDLGRLAAGEQQTVSYTVNYWVPFGILLILVGAFGYGIRQYRKPHIVKRAYRKGGKHAVHLRVENRSGSVLDEVVVRDFLPSITTLIEKFEASPPERIRKGSESTEIEWRLGRLEPGEERILTYHLSSQVAVEGSVTLPPAHLEYRQSGKDRKQHSHKAEAAF